MPKIAYVDKRFSQGSLEIIQKADQICRLYAQQGFNLTLRQLYYQFVSRGWIANKDTEYKRLGSIINDARLAGYIDWNHLEDRTRNLRRLNSWDSPSDIISAVAAQFQEDLWKDQPTHVEVWIEKDALVGVIEPVCNRNSVGYFSCRGYTSQSEIWGAAQRLVRAVEDRTDREMDDANIVILHLGDHDPSGIDMTRDIRDRLTMFMEHEGVDATLSVRRIALNMPQVQQYSPPPNPAKLTDARADGYIRRYGTSSWELDALTPTVIDQLIQDQIDGLRDGDVWDEAIRNRDRQRAILRKIAQQWTDVEERYG